MRLRVRVPEDDCIEDGYTTSYYAEDGCGESRLSDAGCSVRVCFTGSCDCEESVGDSSTLRLRRQGNGRVDVSNGRRDGTHGGA